MARESALIDAGAGAIETETETETGTETESRAWPGHLEAGLARPARYLLDRAVRACDV
jgi:hypothetical protein